MNPYLPDISESVKFRVACPDLGDAQATMKAKLPTIAEIAALIRALKPTIRNEYRAYDPDPFDGPDDGPPSMLLTVGASPETGTWSYQTGDNSYTGGAYCHRYWGVAAITRRCNSREIARDIIREIADQID